MLTESVNISNVKVKATTLMNISCVITFPVKHGKCPTDNAINLGTLYIAPRRTREYSIVSIAL